MYEHTFPATSDQSCDTDIWKQKNTKNQKLRFSEIIRKFPKNSGEILDIISRIQKKLVENSTNLGEICFSENSRIRPSFQRLLKISEDHLFKSSEHCT